MTDAPCDVKLDRVRRVFGARAAVDDIALTAPAGKITALLGASGSGKSTLLRLIAGLEPLDGGRVLFGDAELSAPGTFTPPERRGVGFVFQDFALFPHMTTGANVGFGLAPLARDVRIAAARDWLDRVGLGHRFDAYPHELSGGEQQRVALARALAPRPRVVLLDEPFSGLDPSLRADLRDRTLDAITAIGATTLFVTHDADEALYVADRIAILREGKLVQDDEPRALYEHPNSPAAAAALGPVNTLDGATRGGAFETPFGLIETKLPDGPAVAVVRAEALRFAPTGAAVRVATRRPQGAYDLVRLEAGGVLWRSAAPWGVGPNAGEIGFAAIDPSGAYVFSRV